MVSERKSVCGRSVNFNSSQLTYEKCQQLGLGIWHVLRQSYMVHLNCSHLFITLIKIDRQTKGSINDVLRRQFLGNTLLRSSTFHHYVHN